MCDSCILTLLLAIISSFLIWASSTAGETGTCIYRSCFSISRWSSGWSRNRVSWRNTGAFRFVLPLFTHFVSPTALLMHRCNCAQIARSLTSPRDVSLRRGNVDVLEECIKLWSDDSAEPWLGLPSHRTSHLAHVILRGMLRLVIANIQ